MNIAKLTEKQCSQCWAMGYCDSCAADMGEDNKLDAKKDWSVVQQYDLW